MVGRDDGAVGEVIRDIHPKSPLDRLTSTFTSEQLSTAIDTSTVAAVVGMNFNFVVRAAGYSSGSRPKYLTLAQALQLLDLDGYQETFVPRSQVPGYLLQVSEGANGRGQPILSLPTNSATPALFVGHTRELLGQLPTSSVQCVVASTPYWGMRVYDNVRDVDWADGERCPFGFEQTPEGFIRHSVELLYLLKPAITAAGSVWWNLMDTYNTRTPIRGNSRDKLKAMGGDPEHALGWTEHEACRHSAGHMYLNDGELAMIPARIAERASRIGYYLKSFITWNKDTTPEPVKSRVTRQAEQILHLSVRETPYFDKAAWSGLAQSLGGANTPHESTEKLTDVWRFPPAAGGNGHGAEFPLSLPARCIALTSQPGDLVVDPFVGSGTSALAAMKLERPFVGFDISERYVALAEARIKAAADALLPSMPVSKNGKGHTPVISKQKRSGRAPAVATALPFAREGVEEEKKPTARRAKTN